MGSLEGNHARERMHPASEGAKKSAREFGTEGELSSFEAERNSHVD